MDAKRIVPVLQVQGGVIVAGRDVPLGGKPGRPADWACRLELEGADAIIFREMAQAGASRAGWIKDVAGSLFIPFALEAPFGSLAELEEAFMAGADQVLLSAPAAGSDPLLGAASQAFGRAHVGAAVHAGRAPGGGWKVALADDPEGRDALAWMTELDQRGASALVLQTTPEDPGTAALFQGAAQLALSVLFRCAGGDEALAAQALLNGADGVAYPAMARSPEEWKTALGLRGLALRN